MAGMPGGGVKDGVQGSIVADGRRIGDVVSAMAGNWRARMREAARVYIAAGVDPELVAMAFFAGLVLDGEGGGSGEVN